MGNAHWLLFGVRSQVVRGARQGQLGGAAIYKQGRAVDLFCQWGWGWARKLGPRPCNFFETAYSIYRPVALKGLCAAGQAAGGRSVWLLVAPGAW